MMLHHRRASRFIALAFVIIMALAGFWAGYYFTWRAPVVVQDVHEVDGVAVRGGWLDLEVTLVRNRVCDTRAERWLWQDQPDGVQRWVQLPELATPPTIAHGSAHYVLSLPIPGAIPAGKWHYRSRVREDCGSPVNLWGPTVRDSKEVDVTITDPTQEHPAEIVSPVMPVTILPGAAEPDLGGDGFFVARFRRGVG